MEGNKSSLYGLVISVMLSSCCWTSDSTVSNGYPFTGNATELKFTVHSLENPYNNNTIVWNYLDSIQYVKDSAEFRVVFKKEPDIDLSIYNIVFLSGEVIQVYEYHFQKRILIDHKAKTYVVELRAYTKTCSSGMNSNYNNYKLSEYLTVPKIPEGYTFEIKRFYPIQ
jgi:hypothetical protein